jgi:hypothetical protein
MMPAMELSQIEFTKPSSKARAPARGRAGKRGVGGRGSRELNDVGRR